MIKLDAKTWNIKNDNLGQKLFLTKNVSCSVLNRAGTGFCNKPEHEPKGTGLKMGSYYITFNLINGILEKLVEARSIVYIDKQLKSYKGSLLDFGLHVQNSVHP